MMCEGGAIDWLCHANDAVGTFHEVLEFDDAVKVAWDFYRKHPEDTLIVVTGDHETGGLTLGFAGTKYKSLIPTDTLSFAKQVITDSNDVPLPDVTPFYQEYNQDLIEVQRDLTRFAVPDQDAADDAGDLVVWFGCIALLFAVIGGVIFWRYRRAAGQKRDIAEN